MITFLGSLLAVLVALVVVAGAAGIVILLLNHDNWQD
jgi:hypothetical protein